jgi:uncharacterized protein (TIGR03437 family)
MRLFLLAVAASQVALGQVNVLTANYGNERASANLKETVLNMQNVAKGFGKLGSLPVDGQVYAQPLYVSGVAFPGAGTHNVVLLATQHNSVYLYDADAASAPLLLWHVNLGPSVPSTTFPDFTDIKPEIGILSTPVIDAATGTVYVVSYTLESGSLIYRLHALDLLTGHEKLNGPVAISGSVAGTGEGSVNGVVVFDPAMHLQRPGLLLANGAVYLAFGSHADASPWHGWIISYSAADLSQQPGVYNVSPNGLGGSVWQSGRGLSADENGSLYMITGNGDHDDGTPSLAESFLKLTGANPTLADFYTPANAEWLSAGDYDLSAGAALIPGTHLIVGGDKYGQFYLVNGDAMSQNPQVFQGVQWGGIFNFAIWNRPDGAYLYVQEQGSILKCYKMVDGKFNPTPLLVSTARADSPYDGIAISANDGAAGTGILWETTVNKSVSTRPGTLHAFDATNLNELWNSDKNSGDVMGTFAKFVTPTVANGKVYVATFSNSVAVYGLLPAAATTGAVPAITAVTSMAGTPASIAPGEAVTIHGSNLGPATAVSMQLDLSGAVSLTLANTMVLFDGIPAPVTMTSAGEVTTLAPFGLSAATTKVQVRYMGQTSAAFAVPVAPSAPVLFSADRSGSGQALASNAGGSANSPANPAAPGSVISLFATGMGPLMPWGQDGVMVTDQNRPMVALPVTVTIGGQAATVRYAGSASGAVQGIVEIDVTVPDGITGLALPVTVTVGGQDSQQGVTLAVQPLAASASRARPGRGVAR